jgi:hypothetical protein
VHEGRALVDIGFAWRGEVTDDELVTPDVPVANLS